VTVVAVSVQVASHHLDQLATLLSDQERARAARFYHALDRHQFVVAHAVLRQTLGARLHVAPAQLDFEVGPHGKPYLPRENAAGADIRFSLSHSGDLVLLVLTIGREVGVDVERIVPENENEPLAREYFAPEEIAWLSAVDPASRSVQFYRLWTRKEAYLKACGAGLTMPLASFSAVPYTEFAVHSSRAMPNGEPRWRILDLNLGPDVGVGYAASLAIETRAGDPEPTLEVDVRGLFHATPP